MNIRLFLSIFFTCTILTTFADIPVFNVSEACKLKYIGEYVGVYQDSTQKLTIQDIIQNKVNFKPNEGSVPNFGVSNANNWVKFLVTNDTPNDHLVLTISNPSIDIVTFYKVENGKLDSVNIDIDDPLSERAIKHQFYTFDLYINQYDTVACYVKTKSVKQLLVPISIRSNNKTVGNILDYDLSSGIFMGIMLMVFLYNLFIYLSTKDKHYLKFVHYIFWVAVVQTAILGFFSRILDNVFVSNFNVITFAGAMSGIGSVLFVKSFLNTRDYGKKVNTSLNIILYGDILAICTLFVGNPELSYQIVNLVATIGSIVVLVIGVIALKKGNKSASLFLIAWGIFLGSVIIYVLKDYGILPYNTFTYHSVQIGVSIESLLLSFALANKINIYRKEKEESQAKAMKILLDNERLIREQNIALELKVKERTKDLTAANESLESTLKHLKETQSQLVEAEKMASLGQLTAGVAHEINNPINFVTSNVTPLRRDIDMVWEAIHEFEKIALNDDLSIEEKQKSIAQYKQDLDLEYVKTEVEFLLKGMYEGASRTAEIVKSLRVFSRVDEDALNYADINEGVESTLVILNTLLKDKIKVVKTYGALPLVECYAGKLNQVFLNILSNGIYAVNKKFNEGSGGQLEIETGRMEDTHSIYIKMKDNGIGIPKEIREKIFEPFFTTKDVGEGTGLGMSIAYKTIDKHNGKILAESEVGEGTTFTIIIPEKQTIIS